MSIAAGVAAAFLLSAAAGASPQARPEPVRILDVPYIPQSEALCGGAAAAMVMRFWGATGVYAESFSPLVDEAAGGIRGDALLADLGRRGWDARSFRGDAALVASRLAARQPVIALILDRPGYFHFVVVVAWANGRVVYHDPARAPFRVADERRFTEAWEPSGRWTMLVLPRGGTVVPPPAAGDAPGSPSSPCDALVEAGVRASASGNREEAIAALLAAADLCPAASAPLREAAGVRALEENWPEAARLARAAVARDPRDAHAWRILATSAYVAGDDDEALRAWNAAGEPSIDLVEIQGLDRTRHSVVAALLGLSPGDVLRSRDLAGAAHRLRELPSAETARAGYRPLGRGLANVQAVVIERSRLPTSPAAIAAGLARLATEREVAASAASLTGGGERLDVAWRWWTGRPRIEGAFAMPSRAGIWAVQAFAEEQTYGRSAEPAVESRRGGTLALSNWTSTLTRWQAALGIDAWRGRGRTVSFAAGLDQRIAGDRVSLRASGALHAGSFSTWTAGGAVRWRSKVRHEGNVLLARAGLDVAGADAPRALWPGAGTGHARGALLRAHPLLEGGRIEGDAFGRRLAHANVEARRWTRPAFRLIRVGPAFFVDAARAGRRLAPGDAWHIDAGIGLRVAVPGSSALRVDVAKGLRDGSTRVSAGWAVAFH